MSTKREITERDDPVSSRGATCGKSGCSGGIPSRVSWLPVRVDDAQFARLLHHHVDDLLTWLDDYPADQVDPTAVASIRRSLDWMIEQSPSSKGDRPISLRTATDLLIDLMWWLDTCDDGQVDSFVAVKLQESTGAWLDELTVSQRRRLVEVLGELAESEDHNARRYEIRFFGFALGPGLLRSRRAVR
jgi:hypothetical protein